MIPAIDIHCHYNSGSVFDTKTDNCYRADAEFLKAERKRQNVVACAVSSFSSVISDKEICECNSALFSLVDRDEFFYQWVVVDPRNDETFVQAEKMLKGDKVLGIKIHSVYHGYSVTDYADKIFSFAAELDAPVLMHPDHITETAKIADDYPRMKLIIAHLGGEEWINAIKNSRHKNIYTDTSGAASFANNVIEFAVSSIGSDRILFGTDTYSCAFQRGRIDYADISEADKENIFYKNAVELFGCLEKIL